MFGFELIFIIIDLMKWVYKNGLSLQKIEDSAETHDFSWW